MSRRDEREIARGLRGMPGGAPPLDLLDRLRADLPGEVALREDAAARRRPPALGGRWLLAASLAGMTAAGLLALHTMEPVREARFSAPPSARLAAGPERPAPAAARPATPSAAEEAAGVASPAATAPEPPEPDTPRDAARPSPPAGEPPRRLAAKAQLSPPADALREAALPRPPAAPRAAEPERWSAEGHLVAPTPRPPVPAPEIAQMEKQREMRRQEVFADVPAPAQAAPPAVSPGALAGGASAPAPGPESPSPAARLEARAKAAAPAGAAQDSAARDSFALRSNAGAADGEEPVAPTARAPRLWAPEVAELAEAYDDDPADADGWALAAGGTPPPPKVAGLPVHGPPPGALWVRFRVRALNPALAPAGARVEIAWTPGALRDRRLLGGEAGSGDADVVSLSAGELRRGWTAVYEVRPAPSPRRSFERLATLRVVTAEGAPLRELALPIAGLSRDWMDAPSTLRLPCLAAAFAERRALGAPEGYVDLVAAARSLAVARGRRDARAATLLELIVRAEGVRPASPP